MFFKFAYSRHTIRIRICVRIIVQNHIHILSVSAKNADIRKYLPVDTYPRTSGLHKSLLYRMVQKSKLSSFSFITASDINRCSKFFHWHTQQ